MGDTRSAAAFLIKNRALTGARTDFDRTFVDDV